jgi:hypothetical protein
MASRTLLSTQPQRLFNDAYTAERVRPNMVTKPCS